MHFWIDKRSQTCGFNGRHGVSASLNSGRRRNKSLVAPVHRFHAIESATISQHLRRSYQQTMMQTRISNYQSNQCQTPPVLRTCAEPTTGPRPTSPELDTVYIGTPHEGVLDTVPHAQLMRLGGLTKYGMWASFGLTTISVAATKFYVDHQGTFEILLLCTLGVLSAGLLVSCLLTVCKKNTTQSQSAPSPPPGQQTAAEVDVSEVASEREIASPIVVSISQQSTMEARPSRDMEQPPPPYDIAIHLPVKSCTDYPPPSYETAVR